MKLPKCGHSVQFSFLCCLIRINVFSSACLNLLFLFFFSIKFLKNDAIAFDDTELCAMLLEIRFVLVFDRIQLMNFRWTQLKCRFLVYDRIHTTFRNLPNVFFLFLFWFSLVAKCKLISKQLFYGRAIFELRTFSFQVKTSFRWQV